jgi:hypothetical protein
MSQELTRPFPCVVQLGFAGSRRLFDPNQNSATRIQQWNRELEAYLTKRLEALPAELGMNSDSHFLCGISQIAAGADTLFTRACHARNIPQRLFLPQTPYEYLHAVNSKSEPDFTDAEIKEVEDLMKSPHVIQVRVISTCADRTGRFEETNLEIFRVSDVVVCLLRAEAGARPGGTSDLLARAKARGKPTLEIRVSVTNDKLNPPTELWHNLDKAHGSKVPEISIEFSRLPVPATAAASKNSSASLKDLKDFASAQAKRHRRWFDWSARIIIGTHVFATVGATIAVVGHWLGLLHILVVALLIAEFLALAGGLALHLLLHYTHAARRWAISRVVAEVCRSEAAVGRRHIQLDHLFRLPLPIELRPLLRTINVLHQKATRPLENEPWEPQWKGYLDGRLGGPKGQEKYYQDAAEQDDLRCRICNDFFMILSTGAILVTLVKSGFALAHMSLGGDSAQFAPHTAAPDDWFRGVTGTLAIILPVLAVGMLSWSAAMDANARRQTYSEMTKYLKEHRLLLEQAKSGGEFDKLMLESESRLLGETANWLSRRSFTGVS